MAEGEKNVSVMTSPLLLAQRDYHVSMDFPILGSPSAF